MSISDVEDAVLRWIVRQLSVRGRRCNRRATVAVVVITVIVLVMHFYLGCLQDCDRALGTLCRHSVLSEWSLDRFLIPNRVLIPWAQVTHWTLWLMIPELSVKCVVVVDLSTSRTGLHITHTTTFSPVRATITAWEEAYYMWTPMQNKRYTKHCEYKEHTADKSWHKSHFLFFRHIGHWRQFCLRLQFRPSSERDCRCCELLVHGILFTHLPVCAMSCDT